MEDELKTTIKFTEHIFDGSGNKIMNSIQYTAMSIIPLLLVNQLLETQLPAFSPNTPPLSMIIETIVHIIVLLIVLYFVDRTVRYFPSSSGDKYGEVSFETIGLLLVLLIVNSNNSHLGKKVIHLTHHIKERFTNREGLTNKDTENKTSKPQPRDQNIQNKKPVNENEETNPHTKPVNNNLTLPTASDSSSTRENFISQSNVEPLSSLESFTMTGGNYSMF